MSQPHAILSDLGSAYSSGHAIVADPGNGGTFVLAGKSGCVCTVASGGTRILPAKAAGWEALVIADATVTIRDASGDTIGVIASGDAQSFRSTGDSWTAPPQTTQVLTALDARELGVVLDTPSASAANSVLLNDWADATGSTSDRPLFLPAGDLYISGNPWTFSGVAPTAVLGTGAGSDLYGTTDPLASVSGASRIIGVGLDNVIVYEDGAGSCNLSGVQVCGYMAASRAAIIAGSASWADACILMKDGSGQLYGDMVQLCAGTIGVQCGESFLDEQADNLTYLRMVGNNCGTVIKTVNQQSVNHTIGEFHQFGCATGIYSLGSCDFSILSAYMGGDGESNDTFLKVDYATVNSTGCNVHTMRIDGSEPSAVIMNMTAHSFAAMNIGYLRLPNNYAASPGIILRGAGSLTINNGFGLTAGMFRGYAVVDGSTFYPSMTVRNATMANGVSAAVLGDTTNVSQGVSYVLLDGVRAYTGLSGPGGRTLQTWTNGTQT